MRNILATIVMCVIIIVSISYIVDLNGRVAELERAVFDGENVIEVDADGYMKIPNSEE